MKNVLSLAIAVFSLTATQAAAVELENVRALLPKPAADGQCPSGSLASYVPLSFQGLNGQQLCASDYNGPKTCTGVKAFAVLANNQYTPYAPADLSCTEDIVAAWPWGRILDQPDTNSYEWSHGDTHVVCCQ